MSRQQIASIGRHLPKAARCGQPAVGHFGRSQISPQGTRASLGARQGYSTSNTPRHAQQSHSAFITTALLGIGLGYFLYASPSVRLDAPPSLPTALSPLAQPIDAVSIDPATSQQLPVTLPTPQTAVCSKRLTLVGLGVRTVSFLSVRVYVAGLYVDEAALRTLASTPGWQGFQANWMTDKVSKDTLHPSSEELLNSLLDRGIACAVRIVPVRSTDYSHLRDGFTRSIQSRAKLARKAGLLSAETDEALSSSLQALKEAFPKASLAKGNALDLIFTPASTPQGMDIALEEGGKVLGTVKALQGCPEAGRYSVARQLLLAYFADKDEISKPFKESVAQGFEQVLQS